MIRLLADSDIKDSLTKFLADTTNPPKFIFSNQALLEVEGDDLYVYPVERVEPGSHINFRLKSFEPMKVKAEDRKEVLDRMMEEQVEGLRYTLTISLLIKGFAKGLSGEQILQSLKDLGYSIPPIKMTRNYITGGYTTRKLESQSEDESGGSYVKTTFEEAVRLLGEFPRI